MKKILVICLIGLMLSLCGCVAYAAEIDEGGYMGNAGFDNEPKVAEEESPLWSDEEWAEWERQNQEDAAEFWANYERKDRQEEQQVLDTSPQTGEVR